MCLNGWYRNAEVKPLDKKQVLFITQTGRMYKGCRSFTGWWIDQSDGPRKDSFIIYWTECPLPPMEKNNG